ncbi:MAG TPA: ATP-binding protein [Candidatus Saccharimonadales bacterium]|nr:ATP-binding protein [Candidatus Saccharimonadales bacterium]
MLVSLIVLTLYFWAYFADVKSIGSSLLVPDLAAITAGIAFAVGFVSYLWAPKKLIALGVGSAYALLCLTTTLLVFTTGGTSSPFIALWMVVAVFAGVFGWYALLPLFLATLGYMGWLSFEATLTREMIVTIVLAGELPLVASYLMWHKKDQEVAEGENTTGKAYKELAAEYSQVSGKSDVVISAIADGVIALDSKGTIQLINPAAEQIVGWTRQDALSLDYKSVLKLIDTKDAELTPANDPISQAIATNKEVETDKLSLLTKSGKKLLVSITVSPTGQPGSGVIVVFRDITKAKAEEREQAEFISTASHEMRTPVASIEGYLGLALNPNTSQIDDKAREYIGKAHESAQHLGRLFQDLLDVSKAEDGRLANNPKVVDVVDFMHDIIEGLRPKAEQKGLRMIYKPMPEASDESTQGERRLNPVYYANVDNDHLREVLNNLVENAIKYTPKGDITVDIGGDESGEHIVISVADSGIGIPKEDMAHLFQKFYRVDNSQTREIGGTGLGLYLSRRLVEAMNGRIWVESEFQRGSTFYVEIPRISHEEATRIIEAADIAKEQAPPQIIPDPTYAASAIPAPVPNVASPTPVTTPPPSGAPAPIAPPQVQQMEPTVMSETAYVSPPAESIAEQLHGAIQSVTPPPVTAPAPPSSQPRPMPTAQAPYTVPRVNTPITSIEQDPARYLRPQQAGVVVPPRNQNQP